MLSPFRSRASPFRRPLDGHPEDEVDGPTQQFYMALTQIAFCIP